MNMIAEERKRQVEVKGYYPSHDDRHRSGELAMAAACYAAPVPIFTVEFCGDGETHEAWPWDESTEPDGTDGDLERLAKAGALIVAEMERLPSSRREIMNTNEIIHELIFKPRTVERLARDLGEAIATVQREVVDLFGRGLVAPALDFAWGDVRCTNFACKREYEHEYGVPPDRCAKCGAVVEDMCVWTYVGGPVSEALTAFVQTMGVSNGETSMQRQAC